MEKMFCEIWSAYGSNREELECVAVQYGGGLLMFQEHIAAIFRDVE
jgi:hypothetical protein